MRKPFIAGNWKMHKTIKEAIELANGLKRELIDIDKADILICPVFTALSEVSDVVIESNIKLGAQNVYWEEKGAWTGEIAPLMLKDAGCKYVIIGHSERRKYFFETDETVNKRIKAALAAGLLPIVCVGETLEEREAQKTIDVVQTQLEGGLRDINEEENKKIIIAYEPVWAIGTGKTATPAQAQEVHKFIRGRIGEKYSSRAAENVIILYGGSVKPSNTRELINEPDIDGFLVGGASLEIGSFSEIVKNSI
ncbi:MAG: triose-phosphate isomerase [Candidatus Omnitrophota bacterium]